MTGRWIMPGLVDGHVHLVDPQAGVARWSLPRYLAWGVTTVRDVHGALDSALALRRELNRGWRPGPRVYSRGAMIDGVPPTYPDAITARNAQGGAPRGRPPGERRRRPGEGLHPGRQDPARRGARRGEHVQSPGGRPPGPDRCGDRRAAGLGSLEHLSGIPEAASADPSPLYAAHQRSFFAGWTAFERAWAGLDSASLARVAGVLAARSVIVVPTLVLHETFSRLDDPASSATVLRAGARGGAAALERPDMIARAGWTGDDFAAFRRSRPVQDLFLRLFRGGQAAGSRPAPTRRTRCSFPATAVHREMELLVAAGLTPPTRSSPRPATARCCSASIPWASSRRARWPTWSCWTRDPLADIRNTLAHRARDEPRPVLSARFSSARLVIPWG